MADSTTGLAIGGGAAGGGASPTDIVERFLELLCAKDVEGAADLLAEDLEYINVGLPTVRGGERVRRLLRATLGRAGAGFEAYTHAISANGPTVLTERTDVLVFRGLRIQFWVCGRFEIRDGRIALWRDYFSMTSYMAASLRGLLGVIVPAVRARPPARRSGRRFVGGRATAGVRSRHVQKHPHPPQLRSARDTR